MKILLPIGICLAIILFAIYSFEQWFFPTPNPTKTFAFLITNPIPNSVGSIKEGNLIALDSVFRVLSFQINKTDLNAILNSQHFVPVDEKQEFPRWDTKLNEMVSISRGDYFNNWKLCIQRSVKMNMDFSNSWQVFTLKEGNGTKYFFFDTNSTEAVFVAEAH